MYLFWCLNCPFLVTSDQRSCTCEMHWDTRLPMAFNNTKHTEGCRSIFISKHHSIYHRHSSRLKEIEMLCQKGLSLKWKSDQKFLWKIVVFKPHNLIRKCISKKTSRTRFFWVICFWYIFNIIAELKLGEWKVIPKRQRNQQLKRISVFHSYL